MNVPPIIRGDGSYSVGEYVTINDYCHFSIQLGTNLSIGDWSLIGPFVMINTGDHSTKTVCKIKDQPHIVSSVTIGKDCWIGGHASILRGSTIPDGAVIGAGSVVTRHCQIKPYEIWAGNPARKVCSRKP